MWNPTRSGGKFAVTVLATLLLTAALMAGASSHAAEGKWTLKLEPMYISVYGHDQHVLTIRTTDNDPTPAVDNRTAVNLDVDGGLSYRFECQYNRGQWGAGIDFLWFTTEHARQSHTAAAEGPSGTVDVVVFQVADREFRSTDPSEVLYYNVLDDTDLETWTADFYGMRTLTGTPGSGLSMQFGLRLADFDNDYHAVVGIHDGSGSHLDASSNYGALMGPRVGLAADIHHGRNHVSGFIGQSILIGSAELTNVSSGFTGAADAPSYTDRETLRSDLDVAIPVTDFRLKWTYRISKNVALGIGANTSAWWDVPVPPGIIPVEGGEDALHENTIVFFGLLGTVELTF
jgi:hypothetical protein